MKQFLLSTLMFLALATNTIAQTVLKGRVVDAETNESVIGANVSIKGTTDGAMTDLDGNFSFEANDGASILVISFVGYETMEKNIGVSGSTMNLGTFSLGASSIGLSEVEIIADVAIDRKTPVAVSNIKPELIAEKLGTQEFPEILKSTPGVYATKQGGGFGDSRINLRGFDSNNIGVMINGVPINGMENGRVFWSNWAGLSDVTRSLQVQRGLGASKLAISSVGGTINILTKTIDAKKGGNVGAWIGNDGYLKTSLTLSTGLMDNGYAVTFSGAKMEGDGYADATQFEGYSYFLSIAKQFNEQHELVLTGFGSTQRHGQRSTRKSIKYYERNGDKSNFDYGYRNGQLVNVKENFYSKPQISLNHYWTISDQTNLSTSAYVSYGRGGGSGWYGDRKESAEYRVDGTEDSPIDFDKVTEENRENSHLGSTSILRDGVNNHNWYGVLSTLSHELTSELDLTVGLDARYYKGEHYGEAKDLLGGEYFVDKRTSSQGNINEPNKVAREGDKVYYYNDGIVRWGGLFAQAEYSKDNLSAFISTTLSQTEYKRIDYFTYLDSDPNQETDWQKFTGVSIKGGVNFNIDDYQNVFGNIGYFSRAPFMNSVFLNYKNDVNEDAQNEKVFSMELGYGLRTSQLSFNINLYRTLWQDKALIRQSGNGVQRVTANLTGVNAIHQGIEIDFIYKPIERLDIRGMLSLGDWSWEDDLTNVKLFDQDRNVVDEVNIYMGDLKVGDAAQTTFSLGADYEFVKGFKVGADYNYFDNLYAKFDPSERTKIEDKGVDSWELPAYGLFDANVKYTFQVGSLKATAYGKVNNVLDTEYVSDAEDGGDHNWQDALVYVGQGRTWSLGLKLKF